MQRYEVIFEGQVQGVGFRYTTARIARQFAVTGYVCNVPGMKVHLVVEGESGELERFVQVVQQAMQGYIRQTHVHRATATGEFDGFDIRH